MDDDFIKKRLARDMAELKKLCEEHFKQRLVSKFIPKFYAFFLKEGKKRLYKTMVGGEK